MRPRDPLFQLWIHCRTQEVRISLELICQRARALKPDVVMAANIGIGNHQKHVLENANWHSMLELLDFTYAENGLFPAWNGQRIVSQHYALLIANQVGVRVIPGAGVGTSSRGLPRTALPDERALRRCLAESAMFGGHALGGPWGLRGENGGAMPLLLRDAAWRQMNRRFTDFYRKKWGLFGATVDASPVAILYNFESLLADEPDYQRACEAMAQLLMQHQIPFRYVLSDRLKKLADVKVLVLPQVLPLAPRPRPRSAPGWRAVDACWPLAVAASTTNGCGSGPTTRWLICSAPISPMSSRTSIMTRSCAIPIPVVCSCPELGG